RIGAARPRRASGTVFGLILVIAALAACAPDRAPAAPPAGSSPQGGAALPPQKAIILAFSREPSVLEASLLPQPRDESALVTGFLAFFTPQQQPMPYLAAELPSVERGTWQILPDGRMQAT